MKHSRLDILVFEELRSELEDGKPRGATRAGPRFEVEGLAVDGGQSRELILGHRSIAKLDLGENLKEKSIKVIFL